MDRHTLQQQVEDWREAARALEARPDWADDPRAYVGDGARSPLLLELDALEDYLPEQVERVRGQGTLILGVGGTHQSMLLSISAHRPRCLVLVARQDEAGQRFLDRLRLGMDELPTNLRPLQEPQLVEHDAADPVRLFFELSRRLPSLPRPISIDITSGSKDMASIALQLAVDAEDADVGAVYLQGRYIPELGVPVPCSARFGQVSDPSLALALYERRRVESLWQSAEFGEVATLLGDLVQRLQRIAPDERAVLQRWQRLHALAQGLCAWSEARYDEVGPLFAEADEAVPGFIQPLADGWANLPAGADAREEAIRSNGELHLRQLVDAWVWLGRQEGRDPRLRLLRYFSLGESAMEGLVAALVREGPDRFEVLDLRNQPGVWAVASFLPREVRKAKMKAAVRLVGQGPPNQQPDGYESDSKIYRARDLLLSEARPWLDEGQDSWRKIRNACTHSVGGLSDPALLERYRLQSLETILACVRVHPTQAHLHDELAAYAAAGGWDAGTVQDRLRA